MVNALLLTTGFLFWAIVAFVIIVDTVALASEDDAIGGWAVFITASFAIFTVSFTDAVAGVNFVWLVLGLFAYLFLGVAWSFKKWIDYIKYAKAKKLGKMPEASQNKQKIVTWMTTWPLSFTWWVLTYPRHFFTWAYTRLSTVYDRIATKIWESA